MKRFFLALAALAMLFTSCSKDDTGVATGDNGLNAKVNFSLSLQNAPALRTISDGSGANTLVYAIFNEAGNVVVNKKTVATTFPATVEETLVKDQVYTIAVWAQDSDCNAYTVSDDMKVTIDYAGLNNDETRDAFYAAKEFKVSGDMNVPVTMKRPFAQINVGVTAEDWNKAAALRVTVAQSQVELNNVPNTLDIYTGEATGATAVTYGSANIPTELLQVDTDNDGVKEDYKYLSMSYVLANSEPTALNALKFTFTTSASPIVLENGLAGVNIQRNWRTNIVGRILTGNVDFNITIDEEYDPNGGNHNVKVVTVSTAESAQAALDNAVPGTTIQLKEGINYGTLVFRQNANKKVVDITNAGGDAPGNEKYSRYEQITIVGAEGATVDQIDFQVGWISGSGANYVDIKNLTVKDVTFSGEKIAFNMEGGKSSALGIDGLTIDNCTMSDANGNDRFVFQQISGYKDLYDKTTNEYVMTAGIKNLTITNCEVTGAYMVIESRAMENLYITNNTFRGIKARDMLITSDATNYPNAKYTGEITITGNTSIAGEERFVRGSLNNSDAVVVIKDNIIYDYAGADADYIKVSGGNNVTIENNVLRATTAAAAQALLDNAAAGTTIHLKEGVNYGVLYLRPVAGKTHTKTVDWQANNYGFESYSLFEDLTIVGAAGATVDAIKIEGGTYYHSAHSQSDLYPVMLSLVELKNVVFDGITFTGNGGFDPEGHGNVINLSGQNIKVDGLTVKNCVLNNPSNNSRLIYKTEGTEYTHNYTYGGQSYTFTPSLKNITITKTTFNGGFMGLELRETENVTITDNEFNVADRNILLPVNTGCTYSGKILITGNVSNNAKERFVRADGTGDAEVIISGNTLNNYMGADADYIKVTNGNNVTIENNTKN